MGYVKIEFYENGKIKSYRVSSIWMKFKDRISYDNEKGFSEKEVN